MSIPYAIILGIIQGITEFLPISSSAHLVILPLFLRHDYQGLTLDIALHLGTLAAIILYFLQDWLTIIKKSIITPKSKEGRLLWFIILASFPAAIAGYKLQDIAEATFRKPLIISLALILGAIILWWADKKRGLSEEIANISFKKSVFIGCFQALAIIPGVSRSGITIAAGLLVGLKREVAAKFSFLLAAPIILGAGISRINKLKPTDLEPIFFIAVFSSLLASIFSIDFLLKYLKKSNLSFFVLYRIFLGAVIIFLALMKII